MRELSKPRVNRVNYCNYNKIQRITTANDLILSQNTNAELLFSYELNSPFVDLYLGIQLPITTYLARCIVPEAWSPTPSTFSERLLAETPHEKSNKVEISFTVL